jgi:hypothetical protein
MAERVFSIDFGSAFTKVALRRDPASDSALVACEGAEVDFWIPTVVAMDQRTSKVRFEFGDRAADITPGGGIHVFTNFKGDLFPDPPARPDQPQLPPLDALLQSEEFGQLAVKYGVFPSQVTALRSLAGAARSLFANPGERPVATETYRQANAARVAYQFFAWLRERVLSACNQLDAPGLKFEDFPVRLSVPALVPDPAQHSGCKLLMEALRKAGWPLHPYQPLVREPYSNAIGILTKGANVLRRGRIQLGEMFNKGPLITVLKDREHYPNYRALVIDVGAFTTDFAAVSIAPTEETSSEPDSAFQVVARSVRLGATHLENLLPAALPQEKREWLEKTSRKELYAFQRNVFVEGKGHRVPGLGVVGGDADREAINACVADFGKRLTAEVAKFCAEHTPAKVQELILTGGGSSIPALRDALIAAAQEKGNEFVKIHAPDLKRPKQSGIPIDKLDPHFTRGGSALGGASIYFEKRFY